jgi:hypothetical protein
LLELDLLAGDQVDGIKGDDIGPEVGAVKILGDAVILDVKLTSIKTFSSTVATSYSRLHESSCGRT